MNSQKKYFWLKKCWYNMNTQKKRQCYQNIFPEKSPLWMKNVVVSIQ